MKQVRYIEDLDPAEHATAFNVSKKCVQLEKVTAKVLFSLEEKNFHKEIIERIYSEDLKRITKVYDKQISMLKTNLGPSIDKIYLSLSNEFKTKYSKLKETFEKEQKNVADWTTKVVLGNVKEMEQMNVLVNKINQEIKDNQSNFVYQVKEIEKSLKKRIDGVNNSSEYEFDENEADSKYEEEMNKRERKMRKLY